MFDSPVAYLHFTLKLTQIFELINKVNNSNPNLFFKAIIFTYDKNICACTESKSIHKTAKLILTSRPWPLFGFAPKKYPWSKNQLGFCLALNPKNE
jgi:hypothetical protein